MIKNEILNSIKDIILKHVNPERIYLYGSQVNGEATPKSDIDIAYDAPGFKDNLKIEKEIKKLSTLTKVDIKNIAYTEKRFRNRVIETGKVLYSKNKKNRAEDALYHLKKAFERFKDAKKERNSLKNDGYGEYFLDIMVKRFEFTYEMSWKSMKRYLEYMGLDLKAPREVIIEAYSQDIIDDEETWLSMIDLRNTSAHVYDENEVSGLLEKVDDFEKAFSKLVIKLNKLLKKGK